MTSSNSNCAAWNFRGSALRSENRSTRGFILQRYSNGPSGRLPSHRTAPTLVRVFKRRRNRPASTQRVLLVCSPGGHLQQMLALRHAWRDFDVVWATLPGTDVRHILAGEPHVLGHGPTNRSVINLLRNVPFAIRTLRTYRPDAILSTGAGLAVPFFVVGRALGV